MSTRPGLLFYCQHSLGMGHLVRSLALATSLARRFRVVFLNGGPLPHGIKLPEMIEVIALPPLGMTTEGRLYSHDRRRSVERAQRLRQAMLLEVLRVVGPRVLFIELFPFGRKKFANELIPLLEAAHSGGLERPRIVCSLRDILVGRRQKQQAHDEHASVLANRYFDAILVHADPTFARLEESFRPRTPLRPPVHYTGFVLPEAPPERLPRRPRPRQVVISAGGGGVGEPLLRAAIGAQALLWRDTGLPMHVIAGPLLPKAVWHDLRATARGRAGLVLRRFVPDLGAELRAAAVSVSQCGYNTALDILRARVPALVVPFADGGEDEQTRRAQRLAQLGAVRMLEPQRLSATTLAAEITGLLQYRPPAVTLDLGGAANTVQLVERLALTPPSVTQRPLLQSLPDL